MDYKKLICTLLGLPEDSDDATIQKAAEEAAKSEAEEKAAKEKAKGGEGDLETLSARIDKIELTTLSAQRDAILARAASEGKVIPLDKDGIAVLPLTTLSAMVDKLPVTVPLSARSAGVVETHSAEAPTGNQNEICKNLGISEETWKKHNS